MSRSLTRLQAILLGAIMLTALGMGAWGLFHVGERQRLWSDGFALVAGFQRLQGASVGTPVRIRGMEAGVVTAVELPPSDQADQSLRVHMRLDRRFQSMVYADATATILQEGMIGAKVIEIDPGRRESGAISDGARIAARQSSELSDLVAQTQQVLTELREGQGTIGKLIRDDRAYSGVVAAIEDMRKLMDNSQGAAQSIKQDADAIKRMPIVRSYVEDYTALLVRPTHQRHRKLVMTQELFEPGRAVLTDSGRNRLNELGGWVNSVKPKGSEVVVASFADPKTAASVSAANVLTQKQSDVVAEYLKKHHKIQKTGWMSSRTVKPIGLGVDPSPVNENGLPPARVELIVFVPQN